MGNSEVIVLTPRGLSFVADARPLVDAFAGLIQVAVERYTTPGEAAVVQSRDLPKLLSIDERRARQVEELIAIDGWLLRLAGGEPGDLRLEIHDGAVLEIADDPTLESYFAAQGAASYPDPIALPTIADHPPEPPHVPDLSWLHPVVLDAAERLVADGHFREAVARASIAVLRAVRDAAELDSLDGQDLIAQAFAPKRPQIQVADVRTTTGETIQRGTHFIAMGAVAAIRNPVSHDLVSLSYVETIEQLAVLSFVARRLDAARVLGDSAASTPGDFELKRRGIAQRCISSVEVASPRMGLMTSPPRGDPPDHLRRRVHDPAVQACTVTVRRPLPLGEPRQAGIQRGLQLDRDRLRVLRRERWRAREPRSH